MSESEISIGDEVLCKPDGNLRGCEVLEVKEDEIRIKYYPGPHSKWIEKSKATLRENYKPDKNTIIP